MPKLSELEVYNLEARPTIAVATVVASGSVRSKMHQEIATKLISEIKGTNLRYVEDDESTHMVFVKEKFPVPKPAQEPAQETTEEDVGESELFKTEQPPWNKFNSSLNSDLLTEHGHDIFSLCLELTKRRGGLKTVNGDTWQPLYDIEKTIKNRSRDENTLEQDLSTAQLAWCKDNNVCPWDTFWRLYRKGELQCQMGERSWKKQRSR